MLAQDAELLNYRRAASGTYEEVRGYADAGEKNSSASEQRLFRTAFRTVICAAFFAAVVYGLNGLTAQMSFELQAVRSETAALEKLNAVARLQTARMESPVRIQAIAETELGMIVPHGAVYGSADQTVDPHTIHE